MTSESSQANADIILSLCMIVRDNAATLRPCLESIRPWVDEMVIVDTGSKNETPQIVEEFGGRLFNFPWIDDFSAARNESLRHARGNWLFWMDSDDTITDDKGRTLRELAHGEHDANTLGYVMQVHCPAHESDFAEEATVVDHVKMFRSDPRIRFEGRIHEQVLMPIRRLNGDVQWTDIFVIHSGADGSPESRNRKYERDLRILKLDLNERPDHPFVLFNFGMTYNDMGRHDEAVKWLTRCITVSDPSVP
jgi:glycosyltransferase involved in cell wall biosynthesis